MSDKTQSIVDHTTNETIFGKIPLSLSELVSRVTLDRLKLYLIMLAEKNIIHNLVAATTLNDAWLRHILDSAQLFSHVPDRAISLADMGSGAGFPGLVLAIMAMDTRPDLQVTLIESTNKKADFLQYIADRLSVKVAVRRDRIEAIRDLKADVITARALKPLPDLLPYASHLWHAGSIGLFPKGRRAAEELTQARKSWTFGCEKVPSLTDPESTVLVLRDLRFKTRR